MAVVLAAYELLLSEKYASCAVTRLRRSDFIDAMYAFSFVLANFGIAIAARMPMMTTTISNSIRVKPFLSRSMSGSPCGLGAVPRGWTEVRLPYSTGQVMQGACQRAMTLLSASREWS